MPTIPKIVTLTNSSVDVINAIRNSASINYRDYVPVATADADSIREIGAVIMDNPMLQNEFISALVNRIGKVIVTSKSYTNPWAMFKKGMLDFGETVEEIFVNIARPFQYDVAQSESNQYKRVIPDVRSAFHILNYKKFYKVTIEQWELKQAFMSWSGVVDLIGRIVDTMYTGANYDELLTMKYMLAKRILKGQMHPETVPATTKENMSSVVASIKSASNMLTFMSDKYNLAGVYNHTPKSEQYLIVNSKFDADMDVEVLASAFNIDKAEFMGRRVLIDGFGELDIARLNELFSGDPTYTEISQDELNALNAIPCVLVDRDFFMVFDNLHNVTEKFNGEGMYWNYWYHTWKTFSISPFANAIVFVPAVPSVDSIAITPTNATVAKGKSITLSVSVKTSNFAPEAVNWSSDTEGVTVDDRGVVTVSADAPSTTAHITATSAFDNTTTATANITVG